MVRTAGPPERQPGTAARVPIYSSYKLRPLPIGQARDGSRGAAGCPAADSLLPGIALRGELDARGSRWRDCGAGGPPPSGLHHIASHGCCSISAADARRAGSKLSMGSMKSRRARACTGGGVVEGQGRAARASVHSAGRVSRQAQRSQRLRRPASPVCIPAAHLLCRQLVLFVQHPVERHGLQAARRAAGVGPGAHGRAGRGQGGVCIIGGSAHTVPHPALHRRPHCHHQYAIQCSRRHPRIPPVQAALGREEVGRVLSRGGHLARDWLQRLHHLRAAQRWSSGGRRWVGGSSPQNGAVSAAPPSRRTHAACATHPPTCARWSSSSLHSPARASGWNSRSPVTWQAGVGRGARWRGWCAVPQRWRHSAARHSSRSPCLATLASSSPQGHAPAQRPCRPGTRCRQHRRTQRPG